MQLIVPLVIVPKGKRLYEAFVPDVPDSIRVGPSLAELRDEVSLAVMEWASQTLPESVADRALAPHHRCRQIEIDTVALDPVTRRRTVLQGTISVLAEKWPHEDFWIITPTRCPEVRFALSTLEELPKALTRRVRDYCIAQGIDSLNTVFGPPLKERIEALELDVDPRSPLPPAAVQPSTKAPRAPSNKSPEEVRNLRRLTAKTLKSVAQNLTYAAQDGMLDGAFGRNAVVEEILQSVDANKGVALVLVGPSGVGKSAIVREVAKRLAARTVAGIARRDLWQLDPHRFIAGMSRVGQWEERARALLSELNATHDLLSVGELAALAFVGRSNKNNDNLAQFLAESLSRADFSLIGECTAESLERLRQETPAFARLFRIIRVEPMSERETLSVLLSVARATDEAARRGDPLATAIELTASGMEALLAAAKRHFSQQALPGSAIRLLHTVLDEQQNQSKDLRGQRVVSAEHALQAIAQSTGLPKYLLGIDPPKRVEQIRRELSAKVAGQPEAIEAAADAVMTVQMALGDPDKPVATYLFVGPTGVGKTETAKALAEYLYGSTARMLRFDMSEFSSRASVARFVGDSWQHEGELTTALRAQPFTVLLLDEVEKAHPSVFDTLLRLLGEGKLTDARGVTSDARSAVIIMTSNLGVREASTQTGFVKASTEQARKHYITSIEQHFRPEFFNRVDRVVAFRSLDQASLRVVVRNALSELLSRRGIRRAEILVDVERSLLDLLVEQAFDPRYGARPLRRALERKIALPLAYHLVERKQQDGALIHVLRKEQQMTLAVRPLRDCAPLGVSEKDESVLSMSAELAELRRAADQWSISAAVERLQNLRNRALGELTQGKQSTAAERASIRLLDQFEQIRKRIHDLESTEIEVMAFEERVARGHAQRSSNIVQTTQSERVIHERFRPQIRELSDELVILGHLLNSAAADEHEQVTVLFEPLLPVVEGFNEWNYLKHVTPNFGASVNVWTERDKEWVLLGDPQEIHEHHWIAGRRYAFALEGPGLTPMLQCIEGHALLPTHNAQESTQLVRIRVLSGTPVEAIAREDAAQQVAKEQLRNSAETTEADGASEQTVWICLRLDGERIRHVASGLSATAREAVCARWLQSRVVERSTQPVKTPTQ